MLNKDKDRCGKDYYHTHEENIDPFRAASTAREALDDLRLLDELKSIAVEPNLEKRIKRASKWTIEGAVTLGIRGAG